MPQLSLANSLGQETGTLSINSSQIVTLGSEHGGGVPPSPLETTCSFKESHSQTESTDSKTCGRAARNRRLTGGGAGLPRAQGQQILAVQAEFPFLKSRCNLALCSHWLGRGPSECSGTGSRNSQVPGLTTSGSCLSLWKQKKRGPPLGIKNSRRLPLPHPWIEPPAKS